MVLNRSETPDPSTLQVVFAILRPHSNPDSDPEFQEGF
ncbi:hypothetical protein BN1012_Phect598 [Candidatus Phaeomarinobacter ectocarpi]|uniref:Uncharacterized protein n=1 Tax=Candidatus Phaeomarinibacter ectocarpi TaxID=1458461 RepID=X5MC53_9HYPH|nr:hypothetical protein BN1012_Phect598 [Candidatus Phaeomarinobacter ectocarpi]